MNIFSTHLMHPHRLFFLLTLVGAGLLVGTEFAIAAFVHPVFLRLPQSAHTAAAKELARVMGAVMPFWYAAVLVLISIGSWIFRNTDPFATLMFRSALLLWILILAFTISLLAPLNARIARWDLTALPADWLQQRSRWDQMHRFRVAALILALLLLNLSR